MGSVGKHRGAVGAKPVCARNAAIPGARNRSPFLRKSSRCEAPFRYLVVQTVGLAMLIRISRSAAQYLVAEQLEVHFPLPGRSRETHSARLVHHRNDPTATANRLISGDFLHFKSFKRSRNVVLSDVARGGFLGEVVEHVLRQSRWKILRHVTMVVGRGGWHRACSVVPTSAGEHPRRECRRVDPNIGA